MANPPHQPDWLIVGGCPRSGTTLINLLLNTHPQVALTNEHNLSRLVTQAEALFYREDRLPSIPDREKGPNERWDRAQIERATLYRDRSMPALMRCLYESNFATPDAPPLRYVGDKMPTYYEQDMAPLLRWLKPLRVVHVSRCPLDVVNSMLRRAANTRRGKDYWRGPTTAAQACETWRRAWNAVWTMRQTLGDHFLHIKYESLVAEDGAGIDTLVRFLDLDPAALDMSVLVRNPPIDRAHLSSADEQAIARLLPGVVEGWQSEPIEQLERKPGPIDAPRASPWRRLFGRRGR